MHLNRVVAEPTSGHRGSRMISRSSCIVILALLVASGCTLGKSVLEETPLTRCHALRTGMSRTEAERILGLPLTMSFLVRYGHPSQQQYVVAWYGQFRFIDEGWRSGDVCLTYNSDGELVDRRVWYQQASEWTNDVQTVLAPDFDQASEFVRYIEGGSLKVRPAAHGWEQGQPSKVKSIDAK